MSSDQHGEGSAPCVCGHRASAHEHFRAGTECSLCPGTECARFRPVSRRGLLARLVDGVLRRRP
ncbi:MAG: hypothetical protein IPG94_20680 [Kineosporiaceae bacterium]|nr:hypothetical protein [Kineosporiaceae bacterium]